MNKEFCRPFLGVLALTSAFFAAPATAADLPVKARAPALVVAAPYSWSGIYIGGAAGIARNNFDWGFVAPVPATIVPFSMSESRGTFAGFVGLQYQFSNIVVGIEGALNSLNTTADSVGCGANPTLATLTCRAHVGQVSTFGGKLGWAGWDAMLLYAQAGWASGTVDTRFFTTASGATFDTTSNRQNGWYAGLGVDYVLFRSGAADFLLGVDWQHLELRSSLHASPADAFNPVGPNARNLKEKTDAFRLKLTVKFNPFS
jgi:outer membrane immunogenic protein